MSTQAETKNLIGELTGDLISKEIQPYVSNRRRTALPIGETIPLFVEEKNEEDLGKTIVFENRDLGQSITLQTLASFYTDEAIADLLDDAKNSCKLLDDSGKKPQQAHDVMKDKGCPQGIVIQDVEVYVAANSSYLENASSPDLVKKAYEHLKMDTSGDKFPLVVKKRSSLNGEDPENWRAVTVTIVKLEYAA